MVTKLFVPERRIVVPKPPSYLKLDMAFAIGAGTKLMDKSRYRAHGTISGADWADGAHGRCLDFVAASKDYVEIPAAYTQLDFTSEDFSLIMRLKLDVVDAYQWLIGRGASVADGWTFWIEDSNDLLFQTNQAGARQTTRVYDAITSTADYHTIGISRSGTSVLIFLDGVAATILPGVHTDLLTSARSLKIGIYDDKVLYPLDGKIEFLRIFGGIALPASTHLAWHNALA